MRKLILLLLVAVMAFAFAQVGEAAESNKYVGLGVGQTKLDVSSADVGDPDTLDDTDTGIKLFGGVKINPNFAIELGYLNMGEAVATYGPTNITAESSAFYLAAVGILPIDKQFEFFAKLGFHFWQTDFNASGGGASGSGDGDGTDLMFGLGLAYHFTEAVSMRVEFENYTNVGDGATLTGKDPFGNTATMNMDGEDVTFMGLGVVFSF
jgi:OOP family OmpA-OmpF porin